MQKIERTPKIKGVKSHSDQQKERFEQAKNAKKAKTYDSEWRSLRVLQLDLYPACAVCGRDAVHVDHIKSVKTAPQLRLEPSNLQSLCHSCHSKKTAQVDGSFGRNSTTTHQTTELFSRRG